MDSPEPANKPNIRPFSQRRQQVQERRQARRRRKKLGEGLQLIFGGGTLMAAMFVAVLLVVSGVWLWRRLEIQKSVFGAPKSADWEAMSQAVMHRDLAFCERINESVTLWTPSDFPDLPVRTLREECRERILAKSRTDLYPGGAQPFNSRWPAKTNLNAGWDGHKPKQLGEYDRLGEIIQTTDSADSLRQNFPAFSDDSALDTRQAPLTSGNSGLKAQQRQQPQAPAPAVENQRQLSR